MNMKQKVKKYSKKGSILFITLGFLVASISFLCFAYDVARVMYLKSYTRNLASVMALSIVNECSFVYHDNINGPRVVIVNDAASRPMKGYKGKYYADHNYVKVLYDKNKAGMEKNYYINPRTDIILNPNYNASGQILSTTNKKRFEIGADGKNGEVEVHIKATVDMLFLKNFPFSKKKVIIRESATAQPTAEVTKSYEQIRDEQKIIFEWWKWVDDVDK